MSKPSSGGQVFNELKQIRLAIAPSSATRLTNHTFLFAFFMILWCTVVIKTSAHAVASERTLPDICLSFKGPIGNFIYDISLEFPVIPEGQTKGIVSSLSSCYVIISSDKNGRQSTTGSGLCKNSLFVQNMEPCWRVRARLPGAALLMTWFQVRQISLSIQFVLFCCGCAATCLTCTFMPMSRMWTNSLLWRMNEDLACADLCFTLWPFWLVLLIVI